MPLQRDTVLLGNGLSSSTRGSEINNTAHKYSRLVPFIPSLNLPVTAFNPSCSAVAAAGEGISVVDALTVLTHINTTLSRILNLPLQKFCEVIVDGMEGTSDSSGSSSTSGGEGGGVISFPRFLSSYTLHRHRHTHSHLHSSVGSVISDTGYVQQAQLLQEIDRGVALIVVRALSSIAPPTTTQTAADVVVGAGVGEGEGEGAGVGRRTYGSAVGAMCDLATISDLLCILLSSTAAATTASGVGNISNSSSSSSSSSRYSGGGMECAVILLQTFFTCHHHAQRHLEVFLQRTSQTVQEVIQELQVQERTQSHVRASASASFWSGIHSQISSSSSSSSAAAAAAGGGGGGGGGASRPTTDGRTRNNITAGAEVEIVLKHHQGTGMCIACHTDRMHVSDDQTRYG